MIFFCCLSKWSWLGIYSKQRNLNGSSDLSFPDGLANIEQNNVINDYKISLVIGLLDKILLLYLFSQMGNYEMSIFSWGKVLYFWLIERYTFSRIFFSRTVRNVLTATWNKVLTILSISLIIFQVKVIIPFSGTDINN